jgi:putative sugar O-methyltransferase
MATEWDVNPLMVDNYRAACLDFVNSNEAFETFKQDSRYTPVLEHLTEEFAYIYLNNLKNKECLTPDTLKKIKENDKYGSPSLFEFPELGIISPSTIRYLKQSLDIKNKFDKNTYNSIVEIGGGYGGLCKVLSSLVKFKKYYLIDLPEPSLLSKKYLNKFIGIVNKMNYLTTEDLYSFDKIDLVISNYAFSECSLEFQKKYYEQVVKKADTFYLVYNNFTENNMNVNSFIEYCSDEFNVEMEVENVGIHNTNILYGKKKEI